MSLTLGRGPFGQFPAGRFDFSPPEKVVYVEPFPRRVRAVKDGQTVVDSERVRLVFVSHRMPYWAFPADDVRLAAARPERAVPGFVRVPWNEVDAWYEEDEEVFVHVRDPYHRIDVVPTSRKVRISVDGVVLAESTGVVGLYETGLPPRWYFPREDVRTDLLERSETLTRCPYKGQATHWSARLGGTGADGLVADVGWSYDGDVRPESTGIRGRIAFYDERVDVDLDGVRQERPKTPWSR
jgi:uncharacterized protein (DUF427 family)